MGFDYSSLVSGESQLPNNWSVVPIGNVASVNELSIQQGYPHGVIEYIDIASVEKGTVNTVQHLRLEEAPSRAKRIVRDKDILISTVRPNLEHYTFVKEARCNTIASTGFAVVSAKEVNPRFLYYYLTTKPFTAYLTRIADSHTSAYPAYNPDVIETAELVLPPEAEQDFIAHVLGTLDDKIELNYRMNATLEAIAQAIFKSWFVDFDPVRAKAAGRQPYGMDEATAALFPDGFEETELGPVPMGWEVKALGEYIDVIKGRSYSSNELAESRTALVTLKSFNRGGGYRSGGLKAFTGVYKPEQVVTEGELVVAFTDVTQAAEVIGKPAIVRADKNYDHLVASLDLGIIRSKDHNLSIPYLYCMFQSESFQAHTYSYTSGTTVLHLSKHGIPSYLFTKPHEELCIIYENIVQPIFSQIEGNNKQSETLASLRDPLLPKLLSGELRVKEAEKLLER